MINIMKMEGNNCEFAYIESLTLFDMGFFEPSVIGEGGGGMRVSPS